MAASMKVLRPVVVAQTNPKHSAALIFLHGSCDTGPGVMSWVRSLLDHNLVFKHIRLIYPTAPERPYTPHNGRIETVWFDRVQVKPNAPEGVDDIDSMARTLNGLIDYELSQGISKKNIIVGGFSMGGAMALHFVYRHHPDIAGCFAMSSFLAQDSLVYKAIKEAKQPSQPPLFMTHNTSDPLVMYNWGEQTAQSMKALGVDTNFHQFKGYHELKTESVLSLKDWILKVLPSPE